MNTQNIKNRIAFLGERHTQIDETIKVLYAERVDDKYITNKKKEKLRLKEEIQSLEKKLMGD